MSDILIRSVPMDATTGAPSDSNLRVLSGDEAYGNDGELRKELVMPAEAHQAEERFDAKRFAETLPKAETTAYASMRQATASSPGVQSVGNGKPKAIYKGRHIDPVVFDLDVPFELEGVDYETVTLSSPQGSKYELFQSVVEEYGADIGILWLVLGDLHPDVVASIFSTDRAELKELMLPFLPRLLRRSLEAEKAEALERLTTSSTTAVRSPE